jgi:maleylpyruvate isomerase
VWVELGRRTLGSVSGVPSAEVAGATVATARLVATLGEFDDAVVRSPSRLPGWTVGHVLAHLARNAESHSRLLKGALRGRSVNRYPGGRTQRAEEIEVGANRSAAELISDVRRSAEALQATWESMTADAWAVVGRGIDVDEPAHGLPWKRWREIEVHHADLGQPSFSYTDWSREYVRRELRFAEMAWRASHPMGMTPLPSAALRLNPHDRLAWLMGRIDVSELPRVEQWW